MGRRARHKVTSLSGCRLHGVGHALQILFDGDVLARKLEFRQREIAALEDGRGVGKLADHVAHVDCGHQHVLNGTVLHCAVTNQLDIVSIGKIAPSIRA